MKRTTTATVVLLLFLATPLMAQEEAAKAKQPNQPMPGMGMMMHRQQGQPGAPMGLGALTAEQRTKMQDLRLAQQKEMLPLHTQLQKLQADLKLEITADKVNESKVKSVQGEISWPHGPSLHLMRIAHEPRMRVTRCSTPGAPLRWP